MGVCAYCRKKSRATSSVMGFCADCVREHFSEIWPRIKELHDRSRRTYALRFDPPRSSGGSRCSLCMHRCLIAEGEAGFCGLRRNQGGKLTGGRPHEGNLSYYYDPLPTNCVASFVCPAGTGRGYPHYAISPGPEFGRKNLAVFHHACSFNCLYCQNYHFKERTADTRRVTAAELAAAVDENTTCICYFGGDPSPQILHALKASSLALERSRGRALRICWETNGAMEEPFLTMMAELSFRSGGCIKVDLKAWNPCIHAALCGVSNERILENFRRLSAWIEKRPEPPFLIASTLLVPGYVDEAEVAGIAGFLANLHPEIPYSLLAFHPHFMLSDLPTTSRTHAHRCKEVAERAGLMNVHVGNLHLLGRDYNASS